MLTTAIRLKFAALIHARVRLQVEHELPHDLQYAYELNLSPRLPLFSAVQTVVSLALLSFFFFA